MDTQICDKCGAEIEPLLVTATINEWDANDEQVERMPEKYHHLKSEWVSTGQSVCVGWHVCPECRAGIDKPWIEEE